MIVMITAAHAGDVMNVKMMMMMMTIKSDDDDDDDDELT